MRILPLLLLAAALVSAGCFGGGDDEGDDGGDTTPTPSPTPATPTPTATPPGDGNETDENDTTPPPATPKQPQELHNQTYDLAQAPDASGAPTTVAITVPEGYTMGFLNVTFTPKTAPLPAVQNAVAITFTDSAGNALTCSPEQSAVSEVETCSVTGAVAAGEGALTISGEGLIDAHVALVVTG